MGKGEKAKGGGRSAAVEYTVGAKRSLAREGEGSLSPPAKSKPGERGGEGGMETSPPGTPRPRVDPEDGSY
ncbi:hypothetical protein DIPPA_17368 [Diplonema papillatum]|nr:hypothetical protein DIPPA_17368 [Diplonema papillatum]